MKTGTINSKNFLVTILLLVFLAATSNLASAQLATGLNFDGNDDYVSCANISSSFSTGQVSGEAWVFSNIGYMPWGSILKNWTESTGGAFHFGLDEDGAALSIYITQSNGTTASVVGSPLSSGGWHHVAFSADGSMLHLYMDGNEAGSPATYDGTLSTGISATFIGAKPGDSQTAPASLVPGFWNGSMDEIRIWNRGLSQSEIQDHMNCELTGSQTGLVAYYTLNQGYAYGSNSTETTMQDASGNNNNATLINFALNGFWSNWIMGTLNCGTMYTYYFDGDHDGYGKTNSPTTSSSTEPPTDYAILSGDCQDGNYSVNPATQEVCNSVDDNCNGTIDEGCGTVYTYYWDADGDGYGDATYPYTTNDPTVPGGYAAVAGDCWPNTPSAYPGATEICDGIDDNCNGQIDEGCFSHTYYLDYDGDGYGQTDFTVSSYDTIPPTGYAALSGDCNDWDISINPVATEICNYVDDNCDGTTDEGCTSYTYYFDGDGDGYGRDDSQISSYESTPPFSYSAIGGDCNDFIFQINPGATEVCNTFDDNCDGVTDPGCTTGQLPDFTMNDISGVTHHFYGDLASGNAVVIEFSTGWCPFAHIAEPIIANVYDDICQGQGSIKLYDIVFENENPGWPSDSAYGVVYANHYNATFPVITNSQSVYNSFWYQYQPSGIPWFLVVIPDTNNPANSSIYQFIGAIDGLKDSIENALTSHGYAITPPPSLSITVTGDVCSFPSPVTLTSNQSSGIAWSTGETTQSITITEGGDYTLSYVAGCGTITKKIHIGNSVQGILTSSASTACAGGKGLINLDYTGGSSDAELQISTDGTTWSTYWPGFSGSMILLNQWSAGTTVYFRVKEHIVNSVGLPDCDGYSDTIQIVSQQMTDPALEITSSADCFFPATLTSNYTNGNMWSTDETTQSITVTDPNYYYVISNATCGQVYDDIFLNDSPITWYQDADGDGWGNGSVTTESCFQPSGYASDNTDCNDADAAIHPYAIELCNSIDDDCSGFIDEGCGNYTYYFDGDGDGYGKDDFPLVSNDPTAPSGYSVMGGDCNDGNASVNPGESEVCNNGADDNCDGYIDEGTATYYRDADHDGYGNPNVTIVACTMPAGFVDNGGDCNDNKAVIHPGANDVCNGIDDDCDGQIDEDGITATVSPSGFVSLCQGGKIILTANAATGLKYQWMKDGMNISGATKKTYTAKASGNYQVQESKPSGCSATSASTTVDVTAVTASITPLGDLNICVTGSVVLQANTGVGLTYQWMKGKTNIAGATNSAYTARSKGTYKVIVTSNGCSKTSTGVLVTKSCKLGEEGSDDEIPTSELNIYPNPTTGVFIVDLNLANEEDEEVTIQLYNSIGQLIQQEKTTSTDGRVKQEIHLAPEAISGLYLVRVIASDELYTKQLIIQK